MSKRSIEVSEERLVEEGEVAGDYLEQFLDILDFDGDIDLDVAVSYTHLTLPTIYSV